MRSTARRLDTHTCPTHGGGTIVVPCAQSVLVNSLAVAHLGDYATCDESRITMDVLSEGAQTVYVEQLPLAAMGHATIHGGTVVGGLSPDVFVGGPTFAIPKCVVIDGPPEFQNKVLRDMWLLSCTDSGKALFAKLDANGHKVTIVPESERGNSYAVPEDSGPSDVTVRYNPDILILGMGRDGYMLNMPPPIVLGHELVHAEHMTAGTQAHGKDSKPPRQGREEMRTIGVGSYEKEYPSENSIRRDLGQRERKDHDGFEAEEAGPSLRPGKY